MIKTVTVNVTVTRTHIARGKRLQSNCCPISLAIVDAIQGVKMALVDPKSVWLLFEDNHYGNVPLPKSVGEIVNKYDHGEKIGPFSFPLSYHKRKYSII